MTKLVNFEDNIYMVLARIRMIRDLLTLDADPELFLHKTLDDIEFVDHTLETLLGNLLTNQRLIELEGLLNDLSELDWQFSLVLSDFMRDEKHLYGAESSALKERITILRSRSNERQKKAENTGSAKGVSGEILEFRPQEPVVSSNELNELLRVL